MLDKKLTFNEVPELYESIRPKYPEKLFEDIIELTGISEEGKILEIGCGTGQATLPLAEKNFSMVCIEIGDKMANYASQKFSTYPKVKIINNSFEDWNPQGELFDLVISAQAFHWIDSGIGYPKVSSILKNNGFMALIWIINLFHENEMFNQMQEVYKSILPQNSPPNREPVEIQVKNKVQEIDTTELFESVKALQYPFEIEYSSEQYLALLNTYSDHRALEKQQKDKLFEGIKSVIDNHGGKLQKPHVATLYLAKKKI